VSAPLGVAVVGCGLIGARRAGCVAAHVDTRLVSVVDLDGARAATLAGEHGARVAASLDEVLDDPSVHVVVAATPNGHLADVACRALAAGRHVLVEKPMGRSAAEAERMAAAAQAAGCVLAVGFNHRHHPGLEEAHRLVRAGSIGRVLQLRARYGHGARPGCEREWRADPELAGGGELLDQGVHLADLFRWFAGPATAAQGIVQTAVWKVEPLEDNAFALFTFQGGAVGQFHVSMTQWKNLFSFEVHGEMGAVVVEGLGGSYGVERLIVVERNQAGGPPRVEERVFDGPDGSWCREWAAYVDRVRARDGSGAAEGVAAMRMIDAVYRAAREGAAVPIQA